MSLLNYMFDSKFRQRDDIDATRERVRRIVASQQLVNQRRVKALHHVQGQVCELAVLTKALLLYLKSTPGFDQVRFDAILDDLHATEGDAEETQELPPPATRRAPTKRAK